MYTADSAEARHIAPLSPSLATHRLPAAIISSRISYSPRSLCRGLQKPTALKVAAGTEFLRLATLAIELYPAIVKTIAVGSVTRA